MTRQPVFAVLAALPLSLHAAPAQRCDLVSVADTTKCLDLSKLNGATLRVPTNTTRIPADGLSLCGLPGSVPPPVDIVFAVDQTASMVPTAIFASAEDTSGWYECNDDKDEPQIKYVGSSIDFHGNTVKIVDPSTPIANLRAVCKVAGDPYNVRVAAMQTAIRSHASASPLSSGATIDFGPGVGSFQPMTAYSATGGIANLVNSLKLQALSGTNYEATLTWGRIQLFGGTSATGGTIAPSPHADRAIILLSDGRPSKGTWQKALDSSASITMGSGDDAVVWKTANDTVPRVYGIFMGVDGVEGSTLETISNTTGGAYYQIPPNMPDSLGIVIQKILGALIKPASPEAFLISNLTNGQTSKATTSKVDGNSFQMHLDSLVGLEPGPNALHLALQMGGKTIQADWNILVADTSAILPASALSPHLQTRCGPASTLVLRPDVSGTPWADTADRNILATLTTRSAGMGSLPVVFQTSKSSDLETVAATVPVGTSPDQTLPFASSIPWQELSWSNSVPGDLVLRSGPAWDSALASFRMPRDRRDTASARIALHHQAGMELALTPEVDGPSGTVSVRLTDPNVSTPQVAVTIRHRLGDTLVLALLRGTDGTYRGDFPFAQGAAIVGGDAVLELGADAGGIDSISGHYQNLTSWSMVRPAAFRLRFVDPATGEAVDTLSLDLGLGDSAKVVVQAWMGAAACGACTGSLSVAPSTAAIEVPDAARLVGGLATVTVKATAPVVAGSILFTHDSTGANATVKPVRVTPAVPDSVVYLDADGDGALDRAVVHGHAPWAAASRLQLPWPDSTRRLDVANASLSLSSDLFTATYDFAPQSPDTTVASMALKAKWRGDADWPWKNVPVFERIAPVPLRAWLSRGRILDTLRIFPSEKLLPSTTPADDLAGIALGGAIRNLTPRAARVETSTGALLLLFPTDSSHLQVNPGDSVRFLSSMKDAAGNAPGTVAKAVVVQGADPLPRQALVVDSDADGRADRVVVRLAAPLTVTDRMGFAWPDTTGALQERWLPVESASRDSLDRILTFDLDPWEFGATSCPASGCANLGWMASSRFGAEVRASFALRDGVDPIPLGARYRYSADGTTSDTLLVAFSEPLKASATGAWISLGRPSRDSLGAEFAPKSKPRLATSRLATFLVDSLFPAKPGDSLRIAAAGALSDTSLNVPETLAHWIAIEWGRPPPALGVGIRKNIVRSPPESHPVSEPPLTALVRDPTTNDWNRGENVGAPLPEGLEERFGGPVVRLNRIPKNLSLYIYDNMGTAVLDRDLSDLAKMEADGLLKRTRRGDYEVWLAWNGKDRLGNAVASGVYTFRVVGWFREGTRMMVVNGLVSQGIFRRP